MKKWSTIAVMLGIVMLLGGIATWDEWQTKKDGEIEKLKNRVTEIKIDQIESLSYENKNHEEMGGASEETKKTGHQETQRFTLVAQSGSWKIQNPIVADGDDPAIQAFIKSILEYSYGEVVAQQAGDWEKFGLKDPQRTLTFHFKDPQTQASKQWSFFLGNKVPVGYSVYFRTSDSDKVYLGGQHILLATAKSLFELRDKRVANIDAESIKSLRYLQNKELSVEMEQKDSQWTMVKPVGWEMDSMDLKDYLGSINELKASSFEDGTAVALVQAFQSPTFELQWTDHKQQVADLKFLELDGKYWVKSGHSVPMELVEADFKKLKRQPEDFRLKRIFGNGALDLVKLDIDGEKYQRTSGRWYKQADAARLGDDGQLKAGEKGGIPEEVTHISTFVVDLEFLKTDRFYKASDGNVTLHLARQPLHNIQLEFKDSGTKSPIKVELFESDDQNHFLLRRSGSETIFRVNRSSVANMNANAKAKDSNQGGPDSAADQSMENLLDDQGGEELPLPSES